MAPMATMLDEAQRLIGHKFDNTQVLWEALSAAGSASSAPDGNKRLALLGDVVLKFVVLNNWFKSGKPRGYYLQRSYRTLHLQFSRNRQSPRVDPWLEHQPRQSGKGAWADEPNQQQPLSTQRGQSGHHGGHSRSRHCSCLS